MIYDLSFILFFTIIDLNEWEKIFFWHQILLSRWIKNIKKICANKMQTFISNIFDKSQHYMYSIIPTLKR